YSVVSYVMDQVRDTIAQRGLSDATHIMMAHLFAAGATGSDSEKNIVEDTEVGTLGQVQADMFESMEYGALWLLHGHQTISNTVRRGGSPVADSFSEYADRKSMWLIDTGVYGLGVEPVDIPQLKTWAVLKDTIAPLLESEDFAWAE